MIGTDLWTTGIRPWIAGIVSAEYSPNAPLLNYAYGVKLFPVIVYAD